MRILVTGATGYIGGRLVPQLLEAGHEVRCLTRAPACLSLQGWSDRVEIVAGDVLDAAAVKEALADCDAAYYLVRSLSDGNGFEERDRTAAATFSEAAASAGIGRIIYLGELGDPGTGRSRHLASRHEVGRILASGPTPVTEIRAGTVIGSGSLSFETLRSLTAVLPVMLAPRWVASACQPVAIEDVLASLVDALQHEDTRIVDLGGPDVLSYADLIHMCSEEFGLRRRRVFTSRLIPARMSVWWIGLVSPLPRRRALPLVESLQSGAVVRSPDHRIGDTPVREAIRRALRSIPAGTSTRWPDAGPSPAMSDEEQGEGSGALYLNRQIIPTEAAPAHVYWAFSRIGGSTGYYWLDWAWRLRGFLDRLVGGVGLRRGRRHPTDVRPGESIDFWRVEVVEPGRLLRLRAEMRLPGEAWVEWEVRETESGSDLVQSAWFRPRGLWGRIYWFVMMPAHRLVFPNMACRIAAIAEERDYASSW